MSLEIIRSSIRQLVKNSVEGGKVGGVIVLASRVIHQAFPPTISTLMSSPQACIDAQATRSQHMHL